MAIVHGIRTAQEFRTYLGRTGLSKIFKKNDPAIEELLRKLHTAEVWRGKTNAKAIASLRGVRKDGISWLAANEGQRRAARPKIKDLVDNVHARINVVVEEVYKRKPKSAKENWDFLGKMHNLKDEKGRPRKVSGPADKTLSKGYILERATKSHFFAHNIREEPFKMWQKACANNQTKLDLDEWVNHILIPQSEDDPFRTYFKGTWWIQQGKAAGLKKKKVKYCDAEERKDYEITIRQGKMYEASGNLYDTSGKQTAHSGPGWAIYVVSHSNVWYSESHIVGEFHHSSFLSGAPVKAAGEIKVAGGKIEAITNKTGHYLAGPKELAEALKLLHRKGVTLHKIQAGVLMPPKGFAGPQTKFWDGQTFINAGGDLPK